MFQMIVDYLMARVRLLFRNEEAASAIEYAIVVAMVAVVVVAFVTPSVIGCCSTSTTF